MLFPAQGPAATKRISSLLRSHRWTGTLIEHLLWRQADRGITQLAGNDDSALVTMAVVGQERPTYPWWRA
jgi:hypothetical protein